MGEQLKDIIRCHYKDLFFYTLSRVKNHHDAEDILQKTFLKYFESYELKPIEKPRHLLFKILTNVIGDYYRKKYRTKETFYDEYAEPILVESIEDKALTEIMSKELANHIKQLRPAERDLLIELFLNGKSVKEISNATGDSVNSINSKKQRIIEKLKKKTGW